MTTDNLPVPRGTGAIRRADVPSNAVRQPSGATGAAPAHESGLTPRDVELLDTFTVKLAAHGVPNTHQVTEIAAGWYLELQAREDARVNSRDLQDQAVARDGLRARWGREYEQNVNFAREVIRTMPADEGEAFLNARDSTGRAIMNIPGVLGLLAQAGRAIHAPAERPRPPGSLTPSARDRRIADIVAMMDTRAYRRAEALQAEYRSLIDQRLEDG